MIRQVEIPLPVAFLIQKLEANGFEAYLVGGAVRDALLSKTPVFDWDITTNATPEQMLSLFQDSFYDNNFGTVMVAPKHIMAQLEQELGVKFEDELDEYDVFDLTTFRSEAGYTDNRRPDKVEWGQSLEEDVKRRDFTINALAIKITDLNLVSVANTVEKLITVEVEIIDFHEGIYDLETQRIRAVGNPVTRFQEDALRMMRAIRIGAELGFTIEETTLLAIQQEAHRIASISGERIRTELFKILASNYPADGIMLLYSSRLLEFILPELLEGLDIPQGGHHKYDVWHHAIESLRECPSKDPLVRLATLIHDIGKPRTMRRQGPRGVTFYGHEVIGARMSKEIAERLRLSNKQREKLYILVRWHMFTYDSNMTDTAIRRFIKHVGVDNINDMMMLRVGDRKGGGSKATSWRLRELQQRIGENLYEPMSVRDLAINGHDLMQLLQVPPSKILGQVLNQLFEEVMEGTVPNQKLELEKRAKALAEEFAKASETKAIS